MATNKNPSAAYESYTLPNGQTVAVIWTGEHADLEYVRNGEVEKFRSHVPKRTVYDLRTLEGWRLVA